MSSSSKTASEMAPPPKNEPGGLSSEIDTDSDGTLSEDEYDLMISEMGIQDALTSTDFFAQYDLNEDGEISSEEMPEPEAVTPLSDSQALSDVVSEIFSEFDTNQDGTISPEEFAEMFASLNEETETGSSAALQRMATNVIQTYEGNYEFFTENETSSILDSIV
jgi:Ca2+-binding EF-hand superfamily protein